MTDKKFAGPFVKQLDEALQYFNIHRQQYLGGVLVGNHITKNKICSKSVLAWQTHIGFGLMG